MIYFLRDELIDFSIGIKMPFIIIYEKNSICIAVLWINENNSVISDLENILHSFWRLCVKGCMF